jgi:hypothetical protein
MVGSHRLAGLLGRMNRCKRRRQIEQGKKVKTGVLKE